MAVLADLACLFNRVIVTLVALVVVVAAISVLVAPEQALATVQGDLAALQRAPVTGLVGAALVIGLVAALLLVVEMLPWRLPPVYQASVNGGLVEYPASLVATLISREISGLDGVRGARVKTQGARTRVDVLIRLSVCDEDDCHGIAGGAIDAIRGKVTGLGLEVGQILLTIDPTGASQTSPQRRLFAIRKA